MTASHVAEMADEVAELFAPRADAAVDDVDLDPSWTPIDLRPVLAGTHAQPMPTVLRRNDEEYLLYPAGVNGVHGDSGAGKGWLVCYAIHQEIRQGHGVIYLDLEDNEASITARLISMGATVEQIINHLDYIRPQVPFGPAAVQHLIAVGAARSATLCVIDSLGEAFALAGVNEDKDSEVGPWYRMVARPLAESGMAVLLVDHTTKAADNPLYPSGSKRKRAAITGAMYLAEATKPFKKGDGGRLRITCAKDRHGNYRKGEVVANLVMTASLTSAVRLEMWEPLADDRGTQLGAILAARSAVEAAKSEGRPVIKSELRGLMKIKASTDDKKAGIEIAIGRGALEEQPGARNAKLVTYVRDLTEDECK